MGTTIGRLISDIKSTLRAENIDQHISSRFIYNTLIDEAYLLMRQKKNAMNMSKDNQMVKFLNCVDMVLVDGDCCNINDKVMRTKEKIEALNLQNGDGIIYVSNADGSKQYMLTDSFLIASRGAKMRFGGLEGKAIYNQGYIYIMGAKPKQVNIAYVISPNEFLKEMEGKLSGCNTIYDENFPCPDDLISYVKKMAIQYLMSRLQIRADENPNMDENIISKDNPTIV